MRKHILPFFAVILLMASCATEKQISYFQDIASNTDSSAQTITLAPEIRLRPEDKISIIVNSKDAELTNLFNLPYTARILGQTNEITPSNQGSSGYIVKGDGTIDFPVLGTIYVEGMTRDEVSAHIKQQLMSQNLVNDPVVSVEYINLQFSVMGEVKNPGSYKITRDRITLLDAISQAGDMTIYGKRDNVLILRPDSIGKLSAYHVDMRSFNNVVNSPAYYIHQNDYIYVEPNKKRANESTVNGNTVQSASFWISIVSLLASLASTTTLILTRTR